MRMGYARFEAILEDLRRELSFNGSSLSGLALSKLSTTSATAGSDLADDTNAVNFVRADHGKVFKCLLDGAAKSLNLPTNMTAADVGTKITIIQGVALVNLGELTVNTNTGNTFSANSYAIGHNSSAGTIIRPVEANTRMVITGANTNSAFGAGSRITCECVAAGEWYIEVECVPLGTGNNAIAFSTP